MWSQSRISQLSLRLQHHHAQQLMVERGMSRTNSNILRGWGNQYLSSNLCSLNQLHSYPERGLGCKEVSGVSHIAEHTTDIWDRQGERNFTGTSDVFSHDQQRKSRTGTIGAEVSIPRPFLCLSCKILRRFPLIHGYTYSPHCAISRRKFHDLSLQRQCLPSTQSLIHSCTIGLDEHLHDHTLQGTYI